MRARSRQGPGDEENARIIQSFLLTLHQLCQLRKARNTFCRNRSRDLKRTLQRRNKLIK